MYFTNMGIAELTLLSTYFANIETETIIIQGRKNYRIRITLTNNIVFVKEYPFRSTDVYQYDLRTLQLAFKKTESEKYELGLKAYEAGFQECLEQWSESEGIRVEPYEAFNEEMIVENKPFPRDLWLKENNL